MQNQLGYTAFVLPVTIIVLYLGKSLQNHKQILLINVLLSGFLSMLFYVLGLVLLYQKSDLDQEWKAFYYRLSLIFLLLSHIFLYETLGVIIIMFYWFKHFKSQFGKTHAYLVGISLIHLLFYLLFINLILFEPQSFNANNTIGLVSFLFLVPLYFLNYFYAFYLLSSLSYFAGLQKFAVFINQVQQQLNLTRMKLRQSGKRLGYK